MKTEYFKSLAEDHKISAIPVYKRWNEKKSQYEGKIAAIKEWNKFCDELPCDDDFEEWSLLSGITGVAYVTGIASNIACVDIDTEDMELAERIVNALPYTPCRVLGSPKRYGKLIYKLSDFPSSFKMPFKPKVAIEGIVDIFYSRGYIVAPPSMHSCDKDGTSINYYRWEGRSLEEVGVENLPEIPLDAEYRIQCVLEGMTKAQMAPLAQDEEKEQGGRFHFFQKEASKMISARKTPDEVISHLISLDRDKYPKNRFFLDKSKGHKSASEWVNALVYYTQILASYHQEDKKHDVPNLMAKWQAVCPTDVWSELGVYRENKKIIEDLDMNLVPVPWRRLIRDVADSNGVPREAAFYMLLTSLSGVLGNKLKIVPKHKNKSWEEAHNIWSIYVSPSGTRKSQVMKTMTKFINDIQKKIDDEHKDYMQRIVFEMKSNATMKKQAEKDLEAEICTARRNGMNPVAEKKIKELQQEIQSLGDEALLPKTHLIVRAATPERIIEILAANKTGTLLEYNELSQLTALFKKTGYESLRTLLLDSWDGLRPYSYQTKGAGECFIEKNCSSLLACVQNSIFNEELKEIANGHNDDGFYQRSFIVVNDRPVALAIDEDFDMDSYDEAKAPFELAYRLGEESGTIGTTLAAYNLLMLFEQATLEMSIREKNSAKSSFWGKMTGKVVKVASLLEFIKSGSVHNWISEESMRQSIELMKRQIDHVNNIFPDRITDICDHMVGMVRLGQLLDGITHDDLVKRVPELRDQKISTEVLGKLYKTNHIVIDEKGGKIYYFFNPKLKAP